MPFLIALIIGIIQGAIFGFATQAVIDNKGYYENWFWWGFFFGLLAFVVACAKPQNIRHSSYGGGLYQSADDLYKKQMLNEGGWKCSCGKVQASYVSSCSCGKSKQEILYPQTIKKQEEKKTSASTNEISNAAAIKEYKELMDAGIISQEEFDAKKKQLLGL